MPTRLAAVVALGAALATPEAFAQAGVGAVNNWIDAQLAASAGSVVTYGLLFLGGLMASLLPCVYPLYPVTVSIVKSRSSPTQSRLHQPIAYYLGVVSTYVAFGVLAALTGAMLNQLMTFATTNLLIGVLFVVLALSIIDLWPIPFFRPRDVEAGSGTWGTVALGMSAGLLSSACVGPVVVGILLSVAANSAAVSAAAVLSAGAKMLFFGMGIGLPFLLLSVFGTTLPKGGAWMRYVQLLLAAAIGYFAWQYLVKGLEIIGLDDNQIALTLGGSALVLIAVFSVQDASKAAHERMQRAAMGLALAVGVAVLFRGLGQPPASPVPVMATTTESSSGLVEAKHGLTWHLEEDAAYRQAALQGKNVFIDFYGNWCTNCKEFEKLTGTNAELNAALSEAVLLKIYDTSPAFARYREDPRFQELKVGLPFFVVTDPQRNLLYKTTDYLKTDEMALFLEP